MTLLTLLLLRALAPACATVDGEALTAADLARAWPAFSQLPAATVIGPAPIPGAQRVLDQAEVTRLAARHNVKTSAPGPLCFQRKATALAEQAFRAALSQAMLPGWQLELKDWSRAPLPPGELHFDRRSLPRLPRSEVIRPVLWRGVLVAGHRRYPVWARVKLSIERQRLQALERIPAGEPLTPGKLAVATAQEYPLWLPPCETAEETAGRQTRRTLAAGEAVVPHQLAPAPAVRRGEPVAVDVVAGPARLSVRAIAEAPARLGQIVLVKNPLNGRRFPARITAPGQASALTDATKETP